VGEGVPVAFVGPGDRVTGLETLMVFFEDVLERNVEEGCISVDIDDCDGVAVSSDEVPGVLKKLLEKTV
jgi:hypothetical protein